ncbi:MAG: hypothetical protein M1830_003460 [Pleopsidium flavum]|nr:MAG: hypothetical protein M1830_003460 [Pleopsidium flavum]
METATGRTNMETSPESPRGRVPPELPYSLRNHKLSIAIAWTILTINSCILPLVLFYALWFGTSLSRNIVVGINTAVFGVIALVSYSVRMWHLLKTDPHHRPLGSGRGSLDFFQINFTIGFIIVTIELVLGTKPKPPLVRLSAMPPTSLIFLVGGQLALFAALSGLGFRTPFRISSLPRGVAMRPGIYTIIEDVIAVDTGTGRSYREALEARYQASPLFRQMLHQLNLFWSISALAVGAVVTAVVFIPSVPETVAYGVGGCNDSILGEVGTNEGR